VREGYAENAIEKRKWERKCGRPRGRERERGGGVGEKERKATHRA